MAGHSKWDNIKHRKGAQDAKRAKVFAKISKELMVATSLSGPDPASNSSLRLVLSKARAASMPKKNIESAIKKASGGTAGADYKEYTYGGNVSGVSFLIVCLADNANRVAASVQSYFNKVHGSVSGASGVSYIFDRKGILQFANEGLDEEEIMMMSIDAGAADFEATEESFYVFTDPTTFTHVKDELEKNNITEFKTAEVSYIPNQLTLLEKEKAERILNFIDKVEDDEDVQNVFHNLDPHSFDD